MLFSMSAKSMFRAGLVGLMLGLGTSTFILFESTPVAAQSAAARAAVDAAKASGAVGEQADGFLGFVTPSTNPALASAVAEINAGRAQVYREAASRTGATPEAAGQATAQQLFARLPAGQFYRTLDGNWVRK